MFNCVAENAVLILSMCKERNEMRLQTLQTIMHRSGDLLSQ